MLWFIGSSPAGYKAPGWACWDLICGNDVIITKSVAVVGILAACEEHPLDTGLAYLVVGPGAARGGEDTTTILAQFDQINGTKRYR